MIREMVQRLAGVFASEEFESYYSGIMLKRGKGAPSAAEARQDYLAVIASRGDGRALGRY
ncbi:MAG: hypothetical protein HY677_01615 [Chloroflexi bacterium]|nr:hypothetical protein [Chloroflexota bacterium]